MGKRGIGRPPKKKVVVQERTIITQAVADTDGETTTERGEEQQIEELMRNLEVLVDDLKVIEVDRNNENPKSSRANPKEVVKSLIRVSPKKP